MQADRPPFVASILKYIMLTSCFASFTCIVRYFSQVTAPKNISVQAALSRRTCHQVQIQIIFSSVAALLGSPGQTNYAGANSAVDALAQQAQQTGLPATSIQWGAWANAGMASHDRSTALRLGRLGLGQIDVATGLKALKYVISAQPAVFAAVPFLWEDFIKAAPKPLPTVFDEFEPARHTRAGQEAAKSSVHLDIASLEHIVGNAVSQILGASVPPSAPLMASGLDSLGAVELRNTLEKCFGIPLPPTIVFDYPTVGTIAEFLSSMMLIDSASTVAPGANYIETSIRPLTYGSRSVAASFVAHAISRSPNDAFKFYKETDAVQLVPYQRWDVEVEPLVARFGAYFSDIATFDAAALGVSDAEAVLMDPQQRLLLEAVGEACLGFPAAQVPLASRGVYVGLASSDYGSMVKEHAGKSAFHATSNAISVACGRLSYTFGFRGPCLSIDTACSASLVATHLASRSLANGASTLAYTAGVHVQCTKTSTTYVWDASMLSPYGRCRTLDSSADGYVRGEMVAVAVITTEEIVNGNAAYPLALLGSATNQDGRSSSLTAPSGPAQQEVVRAALSDGDVQASAIVGVSMHGTGTSLGDPIEIGAILTVCSQNRVSQPLAMTASKSWVGHAEPSAGLAGLFFAQHAAVHARSLPLLHLKKVNTYAASTLEEHSRASFAVMLPKQFAPLPGKSDLTIGALGTSAFAFQGTNAHAITQVFEGVGSKPITCAVADWKRKRHYVVPEYNVLQYSAAILHGGLSQGATVTFRATLAASRLGFLWDHVVMNKSIFPGELVILEYTY